MMSISQEELSTIAVYLTSLISLMLIVRLSIPFNLLRGAMLALSVAGLLVAFLFFGKFFSLVPLGQSALIVLAISAVFFVILFNILYHIADRLIEKKKQVG
jgi:cation-transporting ATPase E